MPFPRLLAAAALVALCHPASAQTLGLGTPQARSSEGFSRLFAATELANGKVLVSDFQEKLLKLVDFAGKKVETVGRQGDGPKEYRSAFSLLHIAGDSILVYDAFGRRTLRLSPLGEIVRTERIPETMFTGGMSAPSGIDSEGRLYFQVDTYDPELRSLKQLGNIYRWKLGTDRKEPMLEIATRRLDQVQPGKIVPYRYHDAWAIRPDGVIGRVVADGYEVLWYRDGKLIGRSGKLAYEPIRLTHEEQAAHNDSLLTMPAGSASVGGGNSGGAKKRVPDSWIDQNLGTWPEFKPPVVDGFGAARFDPAGNLWILRTRALHDSIPKYDVVSQSRGLVRQITLPPHSRVIGFSKSSVFVAHADEDDLEWLERYPLPRI
ncbi:MAG: hypothetical protein ABIZ70_06320 [Gemmatimonadales bacterium]